MKVVQKDPRLVDLWDRKSAGDDTILWDEIFSNFTATVDWPSVSYYMELPEYYHDAKVILSTRSPDSWVESIHNNPPHNTHVVFLGWVVLQLWLSIKASPHDLSADMEWRI